MNILQAYLQAKNPAAAPDLGQSQLAKALFSTEGPQVYARAFAHNQQFAKPANTVTTPGAAGPYQTALNPRQEQQFRQWVAANRIPFDPTAAKADYDMRGFWLAQQQKPQSQGRAANGHFPDTYKTPFDSTFSNESKYATPNNPFAWIGNTLVDGRTGQVVFK